MPLVVKDKAMVPHPGHWIFHHPDGGFEVRTPELAEGYRSMRRYCAANGKPVPTMDEMDVWICDQNPQLCIDSVTKSPPFSEKLKEFASSMKEWLRQGLPVVTAEVLQERTETCSGSDSKPRCEHWRGFANSFIGSCGSCGCSGVKLFLGTEHCPKGKWKS